MKLDDGDSLIGVQTCRDGDDVLLATHLGRAIRFQVTDETLRVFASRDSSGVRGIRLGKGDRVIGLAVLRHVDATPDERQAYLKASAQKRRATGEDVDAPMPELAGEGGAEEGEEVVEIALPPERLEAMEQAEEYLLVSTDGGFGKRTSAYEYRVTGRGGQGITGITLTKRTGRAVVATFPVRPGDGVMLITDNGRLIRLPADQVRVTGRQAMGVTLLRLNEGEAVTSCFPVVDDTPDDQGAAEAGETP